MTTRRKTNAAVSALPETQLCYLPPLQTNTKITEQHNENDNEGEDEQKHTKEKKPLFPDLSKLSQTLLDDESRREAAYKSSRKIQLALVQARTALEYQDNEEAAQQAAADLDDLVQKVMQQQPSHKKNDKTEKTENENENENENDNNNAPREGNLGYRMEDYARFCAYRHFLQTGTLIALSNFHKFNIRDEEYLAGACMGLSHDLARYAVGRATQGDVSSVRLARNLTEVLMGELLQFDFRNGPLRKKYDGTKYALKKVETLLYELSMSSVGGNGEKEVDDDESKGPMAKRKKVDKDHEDQESSDKANDNSQDTQQESHLFSEEEFTQIRKRMEHRDDLREKLIKRCRDGQKAAKQAIFALHRGDLKRCHMLLQKCETVLQELHPVTAEEPMLRHGSYSNVVEEYVEAKLFAVWLEDGYVLHPEEFLPVEVQSEEYLGGLCDLVGEVGRYAVQRGTARDVAGVQSSLETSMRVLHAMEGLCVTTKMQKKMGVLRRSVEKLEHLLYELSLMQAGRVLRATAVDSAGPGNEDEVEEVAEER